MYEDMRKMIDKVKNFKQSNKSTVLLSESSLTKIIKDSDFEYVFENYENDVLIFPINETSWMFEFENESPRNIRLDEAIFIPKNTSHRIIKGDGNLQLETILVDDNDVINEEKKKEDRCTRIAKRKYDTWPSAYASGAVVKCRKGKIWKDLNEEEIQDELEEASKTDYSKEKKSGLHGWFSRQGGKGKSKGWVDCNTCRTDKETGKKTCKSCGRKDGEKRSKYPSCRPTPASCDTSGKGEKWGKKK